MRQEKARVTRLLDAGMAEVAVHRRSACSHDCVSCGGGCSELIVQSDITVVAKNLVRAIVGDMVTVETNTGHVLQAALLVYFVPLLLFFVGYLLMSLNFSQKVAIVAGGIGFVFGLFFAWLFDRHMRGQQGFSFQIVAIEREDGCSVI